MQEASDRELAGEVGVELFLKRGESRERDGAEQQYDQEAERPRDDRE